jgi:WD40 repeat protein
MKSLVRAIAVRADGELVVGTRDGNIAIVGTGGDMNVIMSSHNDGEVWGLSCGPDANTVMSSGDDNRCMIWDIEARKMQKIHEVSKRSVKAKKGGASSITNKPAS